MITSQIECSPASQPSATRRQRRRRRLAALLVAASIALPIFSSCQRDKPQRRVSIYGIDGATWNVIDPLIAAGELPNLARLVDGGVRAPLQSRKPLVSPPVWTTIATGVPRAVHGIEDFIVKGDEARNRTGGRLASSQDRKVHALWTIASQYQRTSAVLGWWATYPAESIRGVMVSERALKTRESDLATLFGGLDPKDSALVHPPEVLADILPLISEVPESDGDDEPMAVLRSMQIEDSALARGLKMLRTKRGRFDLEMVLMRGVDVISHHFWKYHEPDAAAYEEKDRPTAEEVKRLGKTVTDHYRLVDRLLGELIDGMAADDVAIVVSDHGFEAGMQPFRKGVLSGTHKSEEALYGIFVAAGGPFKKGTRLDNVTILDVAPTALHLLGLPVAEALQGAVVADAIDPQWLVENPVRTVTAYEGPPVLLSEESIRHESSVDDKVMEQLRMLGYVE